MRRPLVLLLVLCIWLMPSAPNAVAAAAAHSIGGLVVDAASGLALARTTVSIVGTSRIATTDANGDFTFENIPEGAYRLRASRTHYQPVLSDVVRVESANPAQITLALERASSDLHIIAETSVSSSSALSRSSTFYRNVPTERLAQIGQARAADTLRELPGIINGITGDTGNPADDVQLNIRGIGTLETQATLDGHPIAFGMPSGYNYELSPVFGLRNIGVTYGSGGTSFSGVEAIGGVIDFQTLDPTPTREVEVLQGYGTFQNYLTSLRATGTSGRIGYAAVYGVQHVNGAIRNDTFYQPGAAYDQSATDPAVHNLGTYKDDSTAAWRAGLAKLSYAFSPYRRLTLTSYNSSSWSDKTGNGDGDYLDYGPALAFGQHLLATKASADPCPSGTFTATNANGVQNGTGPNGQPDGGMRCQTPQQYAGFNTGYQGAGPSWQSFNLQDEHLGYVSESQSSAMHLDVFTSRYAQTFDRTFQLPFKKAPGDRATWRNRQVVETGATIGDEWHLSKHDAGIGFEWMNDAYLFEQKGSLVPVPFTNEAGIFVHDVYQPAARLHVYANLWAKHASATNTDNLDPRVSVVYAAGANDVVRIAAGKTTTQPSADMLGKAFVESPPGNAGGGASLTCSGVNSIGTAPSSVLKPEKGVDEELAFAHRFSGDTQMQFSVYNVNVYDKLYSTLVPLGAVGTGFIDPAYLSFVQGIVSSKCGTANVMPLLGVTGTVNVGRLQSRGFTLDGRVRLNRTLFVDYDWALTSTMLLDAPPAFLRSNLSYVIGGQLPRLPLHTLNASVDQTVGTVDVRYTLHTVSANNTKALPPYDYSDLSASVPFGQGRVTLAVMNVFNQFADNRGLRYEGVPLALNAYAGAADYAPVTGAASTERFGLPFRQLFLSYSFRP